MAQRADAPFPVPDREAERLGDLYSYEILDEAPEGTYEDLVHLAVNATGKPMAAITFVDESHQWVKAQVGDGAQNSPRSESFCAHAITDPGRVFVVEDLTEHPAFEDSPYVTGAPHLRFYAGSPIQGPRGHGIGTLCVLDTEPGRLDADGREALAALSRTLASALELRRISRELRQAHGDVERLADAIGEDVSGTVASITSALRTVETQADQLTDEHRERLAGARSDAGALERAVRALGDYGSIAGEQGAMEAFALQDALDAAHESLEAEIEETGGRVQGHGLPVVTGDRDQVVVLLRNLLANALHHARPEPTVHVTAHRGEGAWRVHVSDDGPGVQAEDPGRLFGLFEQGEVGEDHDGHGLGLALAQRVVERHGGEIGIEAEPADGTTVWFTLPGPREEPVT